MPAGFWVQTWVQNSQARRGGPVRKRHQITDIWILHCSFVTRRWSGGSNIFIACTIGTPLGNEATGLGWWAFFSQEFQPNQTVHEVCTNRTFSVHWG